MNKKLWTRRNPPQLKPVVGQKFGFWTVRSVEGDNVTCECQCGTVQTMSAKNLRHNKSHSCKSCKRARLKESALHLSCLRPAQVLAALEKLSDKQKRYAAELLRSRQFIEGEALTRTVVIESIEMAMHTTPEKIEQELQRLHPAITAQTRQHYGVYDAPRKDF